MVTHVEKTTVKEGDIEIEYEEEEQFQPSTWSSGVFNLVLTMIGAGAMSLPYTLRLAGWALGLISLVVCFAMTVLSLLALAHCSHMVTPRQSEILSSLG